MKKQTLAKLHKHIGMCNVREVPFNDESKSSVNVTLGSKKHTRQRQNFPDPCSATAWMWAERSAPKNTDIMYIKIKNRTFTFADHISDDKKREFLVKLRKKWGHGVKIINGPQECVVDNNTSDNLNL